MKLFFLLFLHAKTDPDGKDKTNICNIFTKFGFHLKSLTYIIREHGFGYCRN